jgi:hypothetical protein
MWVLADPYRRTTTYGTYFRTIPCIIFFFPFLDRAPITMGHHHLVSCSGSFLTENKTKHKIAGGPAGGASCIHHHDDVASPIWQQVGKQKAPRLRDLVKSSLCWVRRHGMCITSSPEGGGGGVRGSTLTECVRKRSTVLYIHLWWRPPLWCILLIEQSICRPWPPNDRVLTRRRHFASPLPQSPG